MTVISLDDLDAEQLAAVRAVRGPVCIVAGAGPGKTRTVTYRIAHAVSSAGIDPRSARAITHSRKAAELSARLAQLGVGTVDARTVHAACLRVAAQFWPRTGRVGASPTVASQRESWGLWRDALRAAWPGELDIAAVREVVNEVDWAHSRLVGVRSGQVPWARGAGVTLSTLHRAKGLEMGRRGRRRGP